MSTTTIKPRPVSTGPIRLTRRGRLVVTLFLLGIVLVAFTAFSGQSVATGEAGSVSVRTVEVREGDTLWGIAEEFAEPGGIRELVHDIQTFNSLPGPSLVEGQVLAIPLG